MTPEKFKRVNQIFHEALAKEPEHRAAFLDSVCDGDSELRSEVEEMLAAHLKAGNFLNEPAVAGVAESIINQQSVSFVGKQIGHYEIISSLGAGGMGEVFLARDLRLDRKVALKLLPVECTSDRDRVRRFEQEAKAASSLNHPNIVTIHEIGREGDLHFIAEEYIEGATLRRRINEGPIPLHDIVEIALQSANALQVAHAAGIVHRDIKPENIMLRPDGFIKILDFGLAKLTEQQPASPGHDSQQATLAYHKTAPGTILGTVSYMSPEQARGLDVDSRSDLWSLGVVLYEMILGEAPFKGATATDVIVSIIDHDPPPLNSFLSHLLPELERIVRKSLAKDRDQRYQTARDIAADLKEVNRKLEAENSTRTLKIDPVRRERPELPDSPDGKEMRSPVVALSEQETGKIESPPAAHVAATKRESRRGWLIGIAGLLLAAIAGAWFWSRPNSSVQVDEPPPQPLRQITYSLTVQPMLDGKPYKEERKSSGRDFFEKDWKFRLNFISPQPGYLYLLNEGPGPGGKTGYVTLFPIPSTNQGSASVAANQTIRTGWYTFDENAGREKFWLVWAAQPVNELEALKALLNSEDRGLVKNPAQIEAIQGLLSKSDQSKVEAVEDKDNMETRVKGVGDVLVNLVELRHH